MNLSVTEQMLYSTIRIECVYKNGLSGTGTGYFFKFREDKVNNKHVPVIITNKHVINESVKGRLIFTKMNEKGEPLDREHFTIEINNFEEYWKKHISDDVDLCAMPIATILNLANEKKQHLFYIPLDMSLIPDDNKLKELSALEDIVMIGYPNGIWDEINNKPIIRKGVTATHPCLDYNGKKEFMIDAACFPGSSGSPVFILNEGSYNDKIGNIYIGKTRIFLLGTLYAGPQHNAEGEIKIINVPTSQLPISISRIPNNLGLVIKSQRIKELEELFK